MDERCIFTDLLRVLEAHNHPFILLGTDASRWMACRGRADLGSDILIRDAQLSSIVKDIVESKNWILLDHDAPPDLPDDDPSGELYDADAAFERSDANTAAKDEYQKNFLRLWSEETYRINVDECVLIEVPDIYTWHAFLVEEKYHPCRDREDGWFYGPTPVTTTSAVLPRGNSVVNPSRIFVPTIPAFLDALVYHKMNYGVSRKWLKRISTWLVTLLIRYLFLELPHQALVIGFEVEGYTEIHLQSLFRTYSRKPFYVLSREPLRQVRCKQHDPETWPKDIRDDCLEPRREFNKLRLTIAHTCCYRNLLNTVATCTIDCRNKCLLT